MTTDTPPESPSSLLERAATLIEHRAKDGDGPWLNSAPSETSNGPAADHALWISVLAYSDAGPLVGWLRHEAAGVACGRFGSSPDAVPFACAVLGEKP